MFTYILLVGLLIRRITITRRSSKGLLIVLYKLVFCCCSFAIYSIWKDSAAWKILLQDVTVICLHFWDLSMTQNREAWIFVSSGWIWTQTIYKICFTSRSWVKIEMPLRLPLTVYKDIHIGVQITHALYPTPLLQTHVLTYGLFRDFQNLNISKVKVW